MPHSQLSAQLNKYLQVIPFAKVFNFGVVEASQGRVCVELLPRQELFNHLNYFQAGACFTLAEVTGGLLFGTFVDLSENLIVTKHCDVSFSRASYDKVIAVAELDKNDVERVLSSLELKKKIDVEVKVSIASAIGEVICTSINKYYLRKGMPKALLSR